MVELDLVECVIGLGPNLFYNSPMEACLLITKTAKEEKKKGKILFINAVNEVKQEKTMGFLQQHHIERIFKAYQKFKSEDNFAALVSCEDVLKRKGNMAINLYVRPEELDIENFTTFKDAYAKWDDASQKLKPSMNELFEVLGN